MSPGLGLAPDPFAHGGAASVAGCAADPLRRPPKLGSQWLRWAGKPLHPSLNWGEGRIVGDEHGFVFPRRNFSVGRVLLLPPRQIEGVARLNDAVPAIAQRAARV